MAKVSMLVQKEMQTIENREPRMFALLLKNSNFDVKTWKKSSAFSKPSMRDTMDVEENICGRSITVGFLLDSLRTRDEVYQKLHGNRGVKEVSLI